MKDPAKISLLTKAIMVAATAHDGQYDKQGVPYIFHAVRVADGFKEDGEEAACIAVLHDVVEDTDVTLEEVLQEFGQNIADGVDAITRRKGETYMDFIQRCSEHSTSRWVKLVDIRDNLRRMEELTDQDTANRLGRRYQKALKILNDY